MLYKIFAIVMLVGILAVSGCARESGHAVAEQTGQVTLALDWVPNTNHTGFFIALERGYFEEEGITLEIIEPPEGSSLPLIGAGHAQFGVSFQEEVAIGANGEFNMPITAIAALVEHNTSGVLSMSDRNILRFADLQGATFGSWETDIYDEIIREAVRLDGGDPDLINFVPHAAVDNLTGIQREFDATWVFEGWDRVAADLEGLDTNFMLLRDISPAFDYFTPVLVTHNSLVDSDLTVRFMRASARGFTFARDNPEEAARYLHAHIPEMDFDMLLASQEFLSAAYFSGERWGYIDEARWNAFFDWKVENRFLPAAANNRAFVNIDY